VKKHRLQVAFSTLVILFSTPSGQAQEQNLAPPIRISVIATSDFHGSLEPNRDKSFDRRAIGGIDIIAAYLQAIRAANPEGTVLLDAGDLYQGTLLSAADEGQSVVEFYNEIGYDASAVGNHDFDFGPVGIHSIPQDEKDDPLGVIKARMAQARFPFLSANIVEKATGKPPRFKGLKRYRLLKRQGVTIGVIGLSPPDTPLITNPVNVAALDFLPLLPVVEELLPKLRQRGATVIILLAHAGVETGPDGQLQGPVVELARALGPERVDLIVGGHVHRPFSDFINGVPVIQTWPKGLSFARADLLVDKASGRVIPASVRLYPNAFFFRTDLNGRPPTYAGRLIKPPAHFQKRLREYKKRISHLEKVVLAQADEKLEIGLPYGSPVGNLVTDAMRTFRQGIDIAMYNSGGLRAPLRPGKITYGKLYEVVPFDNSIIVVKLSGKTVRDVIEHGLAGPYGIMEISGLRVRVDPRAPAGSKCREIFDLRGEPLRDDRYYTVATNDFVFGGGDGYNMFSQGREAENTHLLIREIVANYLKQKGQVGLPEDRRYQLLEGE